MAYTGKPLCALIEGRAALIVVDIQASTFIDDSAVRGHIQTGSNSLCPR